MIKPKKEPKIIKPNIKPDAPGTKPGDVGNGHVLVVDERTQRFNGRNYNLRKEGYYVFIKDDKTYQLHIDVWEYHNGERHEKYVVHHNARRPDGTFDKNENNIENLLIMTRADHNRYHKQHRVYVERICPQCGKKFKTAGGNKIYCRETCHIEHEKSSESGAESEKTHHTRKRNVTEKRNRNNAFLCFTNDPLSVSVRVRLIDGDPWFIAKDVCDGLYIDNSRDAVARLDDYEKRTFLHDTTGGLQRISFVNTIGLHHLIWSSRKPEAKKFKRWITHNVLPSLREYGFYVMEEDSLLLELEDTEKTLMHKLLAAYREGNSSAAHKLVDELFGRADTPTLEAPRAETLT